MEAIVYTDYGPPEMLQLKGVAKTSAEGSRGIDESPCGHGHPGGMCI